jgi:hypothetical protein
MVGLPGSAYRRAAGRPRKTGAGRVGGTGNGCRPPWGGRARGAVIRHRGGLGRLHRALAARSRAPGTQHGGGACCVGRDGVRGCVGGGLHTGAAVRRPGATVRGAPGPRCVGSEAGRHGDGTCRPRRSRPARPRGIPSIRLGPARGEYCQSADYYRESLALRQEAQDSLALAQSLEDFACLAARQEQWQRAAPLLGAAEGVCAGIAATPPVAIAGESEAAVRGARAALGAEEFAAVWAEGRAMELDEAVALALDDLPEG